MRSTTPNIWCTKNTCTIVQKQIADAGPLSIVQHQITDESIDCRCANFCICTTSSIKCTNMHHCSKTNCRCMAVEHCAALDHRCTIAEYYAAKDCRCANFFISTTPNNGLTEVRFIADVWLVNIAQHKIKYALTLDIMHQQIADVQTFALVQHQITDAQTCIIVHQQNGVVWNPWQMFCHIFCELINHFEEIPKFRWIQPHLRDSLNFSIIFG